MGASLLRYRTIIKDTARTAIILDSRFNSLATQVEAAGLAARGARNEIGRLEQRIEALRTFNPSRMDLIESRFESLATQVREAGSAARSAFNENARLEQRIEALRTFNPARMDAIEARFDSLAERIEIAGENTRKSLADIAAQDRKIEVAAAGFERRVEGVTAGFERKVDALAERIDNSAMHRVVRLERRLANLQANLRNLTGIHRPILLVGAGNSLMFGSGGAVPFIDQVGDTLGLPVINKGVRGQNIDQMIETAAEEIDPLLDTAGAARPILFIWEGLNWLRDTRDVTAKDYVDRLEAYARARRDAGWTRIVVVNSAQHFWPSGSWRPGITAVEVNAELARRWPDFADAMLDVSWLADPADAALYQPDGIHLLTEAHARIARDAIALLPDLQAID